MHARARKTQKCMQLFISIKMHVVGSSVRVHARIIMEINLLLHIYTDSLSFKFYEDPFIGCGEITETKMSMHYYPFLHAARVLEVAFKLCH